MKKKDIQQYLAAIIVAMIVFLAGVFSQGLFQKNSTQEIYGCLSDCFLFPGVLLGGLGALTWIAGEGTFDMLAYGTQFFFKRLFRPKDSQESFFEYKMRKDEGTRGWLKHWFVVGLICLGLSVAFLLLYLAQS